MICYWGKCPLGSWKIHLMQCSCIWRFLLFEYTKLTESFVCLRKARSKLCRGYLSLGIRTFLSVLLKYEIFLFLSTATHWKYSFLLPPVYIQKEQQKTISRWWNTVFSVYPNTRAHKVYHLLKSKFYLELELLCEGNHCNPGPWRNWDS